MLARMDVWKGVDDLLDAAELIRDLPYSLTMAGPAGTAGDEVSLRRKIVARNLPDRVTYIGNVQGAAKDRLLAESDVLVSPSHQEGMPISILEGMAHGLAIVATRVGAVAEMISDGDSGLLVASKDIDSLASSMKRMIQNESLRQKLGTTARLVAEQRFSPSVLARRLRTVYEGILDSGTSIDRITTEGLEPA
jgi:glycosyltransferase involved in cell wall biosynthesis